MVTLHNVAITVPATRATPRTSGWRAMLLLASRLLTTATLHLDKLEARASQRKLRPEYRLNQDTSTGNRQSKVPGASVYACHANAGGTSATTNS